MPYSHIDKENDHWTFTDKVYFPDKVILRDPSFYSEEETRSLLSHWRNRQSLGHLPFRWNMVRESKCQVKSKYPDGVFEHFGVPTESDSMPSTPPPVSNEDESDEEVFIRKPKRVVMPETEGMFLSYD